MSEGKKWRGLKSPKAAPAYVTNCSFYPGGGGGGGGPLGFILKENFTTLFT